MRIMIVDDSAFMRMMIRTSVVAKGWLVVGEATDGVEVVGTYATCFPDIVTMDSTMREMGGVDAVRELIKVYPEARIVMVSAIGQPMDRIEAIQAGAVGYVVKPFKDFELWEEIRMAMRRRGWNGVAKL